MFETDEDRSYFQVTLPIHPVFLENKAALSPSVSMRGVDVSNVTAEEPEKKSSRQRRSKEEIKELVIELLRADGNKSTNEIALALGYKRRTDTLRDAINELLESGEVVYLYPDKPNSRNQKICVVR